MGLCCSSNSKSRNTQQVSFTYGYYQLLPLIPVATCTVSSITNANKGELKEEDLRGIFKEFDLNGDGYIQKDELNAVMMKMGQCPTDDELNAMFNAADKDRDGNIDLDGVFDELDVDGDGCITRSELRTAFQRMGHELTDADIKAIYSQVDVDGDGKISFDEFCQMMARKRG